MTANKIDINLVSYENMTFGEMVDAGFTWNSPSWTAQITNLDAKALAFYQPIIEKILVERCFMLYPAQDDPNNFKRILNNELAKAVNNQSPVLSLIAYPAIMPNGTTGETGIMNIQEGGTEGGRSVDFGTEFPQAMLNGNIGDYGSDGKAQSNKIVKYKPSLDAIKDFNDPKNPYQDAVNRIVEAVETSGVFSYFIY